MRATLLFTVLCMLLAAVCYAEEEHGHEEEGHHEDEDHGHHGAEVKHVVAHIYDANSNGLLEEAELAKVWEGVGNVVNETNMKCVMRAVHRDLNESTTDKEAAPHSDDVGSFLRGFYLFKVAKGCKAAAHSHDHSAAGHTPEEHSHEEHKEGEEEHAHEEGEEHHEEEGHHEGEEHAHDEHAHEKEHSHDEPTHGGVDCHEFEEVHSHLKDDIFACVGEVEVEEEAHAHSTCNKPSAKERWGYTMLSVVAITLIAVFGIFITLPILMAHHYLLQVMLSFAIGALLGDAFYHIIPIIMGAHTHGDEDGHAHAHEDETMSQHEVNLKMTIVLLTILVSYLVDFVARALLGGKDPHEVVNDDTREPMELQVKDGVEAKEATSEEEKKEEDNAKWWKWTPMSQVRQIVWVVLVADGVHNITDGLSIGAGFAQSKTVGWSTVAASALHEIPQEVGDFAVLLSSGISPFQAIVLNLLSGCSSIVAAVIACIIGDSSENASEWILCVTIGSFVYLALGVVVPELLHGVRELSFIAMAGHVLGMSCGALIMWVIAVTEEHKHC